MIGHLKPIYPLDVGIEFWKHDYLKIICSDLTKECFTCPSLVGGVSIVIFCLLWLPSNLAGFWAMENSASWLSAGNTSCSRSGFLGMFGAGSGGEAWKIWVKVSLLSSRTGACLSVWAIETSAPWLSAGHISCNLMRFWGMFGPGGDCKVWMIWVKASLFSITAGACLLCAWIWAMETSAFWWYTENISCSLLGFLGMFGAGGGGVDWTIWVEVSLLSIWTSLWIFFDGFFWWKSLIEQCWLLDSSSCHHTVVGWQSARFQHPNLVSHCKSEDRTLMSITTQSSHPFSMGKIHNYQRSCSSCYPHSIDLRNLNPEFHSYHFWRLWQQYSDSFWMSCPCPSVEMLCWKQILSDASKERGMLGAVSRWGGGGRGPWDEIVGVWQTGCIGCWC